MVLGDVGFSLFMYISGFFATVLNVLILALIITKSPKEIETYKWYLFNFTLFDLLFDILLCWTLQPIPIIPGGGMVTVGPLRSLGPPSAHIQFALIAYSFARCIVGLNYCFLYRFSCLCREEGQDLFSHLWFRSIFYVTGELMPLWIGLLVYDMQVPSEHFKNITIQRFPYQQPFFADENVYFGFDYKATQHANTFIFTVVSLAPASGGLNALIAFFTITHLRRFQNQLSKKTYQLHMKLITALLIQTFIPIVLFVVPITFIVSTALLLADGVFVGDQKYFPVMALSIHPIINAIITLSFVTPYRNAIAEKFLRKKQIVQTVSITAA